MKTALEIANYFIEKSLESGEELTPMKLNKLVYIAHGWYLGLADKPLIGEAAQAWKYGPVIPSVYHRFKSYGGAQITSLEPASDMVTIPEVKDDELKEFLQRIWDVYGRLSGLQLSSLTHQEGTPWSVTRHRYGDNQDNGGAMIPNDLIKQHYKGKVDARRKAA
ncbi:MAG: DUF4065 domain-containing protein [Saprospiraceae bacterium]